jgi:hypothetical protein
MPFHNPRTLLANRFAKSPQSSLHLCQPADAGNSRLAHSAIAFDHGLPVMSADFTHDVGHQSSPLRALLPWFLRILADFPLVLRM